MHLLEELTREEAHTLAPDALVVLPVGATEQHGPHLPVYTDSFAVTHIARAAAASANLSHVIVAPTLPFGSSHHHLPFGGTLSLSTETYYRVVSELVESLIVGGFGCIFVLNGHGGNTELIELVARDVALKHRTHVAAAPYWRIAWEALVAAGAHDLMPVPGHAGAFEASLVLALRFDLVRERPHRDIAHTPDARGYQPYRAESHGWWQSINGFTDSPAQATAAQGQRYLDVIVQEVARAFVEFYQQTKVANEA